MTTFIPDGEGHVWTLPDKHDVSVWAKWDGLDLWSRSLSVYVVDVLGQGVLCFEVLITR
jgi:hypothetical protein